MELKPGYKLTEVGLIPDDWDLKAIGEMAEVKGGKRLPLGYGVTSKATSHPYVRVTDMFMGGVKLDDIKYVPDEAFPAIKNYRISVADIFISVAGTLGIVGKIPAELDGANLTENANRLTNITCDRDFLLFNLLSLRIQNAIDAGKTVGAQPKLALGRIARFLIAVPRNPAEQRAIAGALSDVDALIGALDQLLAKKRDLKQAAMQQLLTGHQRLPGFASEWTMKPLRELASLHRGQIIPASYPNRVFVHFSLPAFDDGKLPTIEPGAAILSNKFTVPNGAILVSKLNPRIPRVWAPTSIPPDSLASTEFLVLEAREIVTRNFLFVLCNSPQFGETMELAATGTTGSHQRVNPSHAMGISVFCPSDRAEQTAIAEVLSDMDAELAALEQKRDKTRLLKQGMMQELLTGRTRLI